MLFGRSLAALTLVALVVTQASAAEYSIAPLKEPLAADAVSPAIAKTLSPKGIKVMRGTRTLCEIWLCKQIDVKALKPSEGLIYPFQQGQLLGVIRIARRSSDFRDQQLDRGVYTLRFAMQPIDGNHIGTSPTRDFALLLSAEQDKSPDTLDYKPLVERSAEAAGASHPAMMSMRPVTGDAKPPAIRHDQRHDWWIARLSAKAAAGKESKELPLDLVVVGHAAE